MHKTPDEWSKCSADAVVGGSKAQAKNVMEMALHDIAELARAARLTLDTLANLTSDDFAKGGDRTARLALARALCLNLSDWAL